MSSVFAYNLFYTRRIKNNLKSNFLKQVLLVLFELIAKSTRNNLNDRVSAEPVIQEEHRKVLGFIPRISNPSLEAERVQLDNSTKTSGKNSTRSKLSPQSAGIRSASLQITIPQC